MPDNGPPQSNGSVTEEQCKALRAGSARCSAHRVTGSSYCYFHDPVLEEKRKAAQSAGGQRNKLTVLPSSTPDAKLQNAQDATKLLACTINQVRRGEIDPKIATTVGYLIALLMKAHDQSETERRLEALEFAIKGQDPRSGFRSISEGDQKWIPPNGGGR